MSSSSKYAIKWIIRWFRLQLDVIEAIVNGEEFELDPEKLLTLEEVSELSRLDQGTLKNYCRDKKIPATKIGKRWLVLESVAYDLPNILGKESKTEKEEVKNA